jgi:hypothetical protein
LRGAGFCFICGFCGVFPLFSQVAADRSGVQDLQAHPVSLSLKKKDCISLEFYQLIFQYTFFFKYISTFHFSLALLNRLLLYIIYY